MGTTFEIFKMLNKENAVFGKRTTPLRVILELVKMLVIMTVATVGITYMFINFALVGFTVDYNLFSVMLLFTQVLAVVLGINSVMKHMYRAKDNELLFSFPCSPSEIFWAKFLSLFVTELKSNIMFSVPVFLSYAFICRFGPSGVVLPVAFYICMPIFIVLLTVLSMTVSGLLSVPVMAAINYLQNHAKTKIAVYVVLISTCLFGYIFAVMLIAGNFDFRGEQYKIMVAMYDIVKSISINSVIFEPIANIILLNPTFNYRWIVGGQPTIVANLHIGYMLPVMILFIAGIAALAMFIIKKYFFNLATKSQDGKTAVITGKTKEIKPKSQFASLWSKECIELFRSTENLMQFFIFTFCMPFVVLVYDKLLLSMSSNVNITGQVMIFASHILVLCMFACLSNISIASTFSREGKSSYWGKIAPVGIAKVVTSKLLLSYLFTASAIIVTTILTGIVTDINIVQNIMSCVIVLIISFGHLLFSFYLDLRHPVVDWMDETEIQKKSKSIFISTLSALFIAAICFFVVVYTFVESYLFTYLALTGLGLLFIATMATLLLVKGKKYFGRIGA